MIKVISIINNMEIYISGDIVYDKLSYNVACNGILHEIYNDGTALVTIDNIDGNLNVTLIIPREYIYGR